MTGRPTTIEAAEIDRRIVARGLRKNLNVAIIELGDALPIIMKTAITLAKEGDKSMIKTLLELPAKYAMMMQEEADTPWKLMMEQWQKEKNGRGTQGEDSRPVVVIEHQALS